MDTNRATEFGGTFDLLVVGGGIVGAGVARDAASRGLRVLLVERADFASGTSSRSSRLLHGGLRYLAQGRIGLVREASVEKMRLSKFAPHLCQSLPFVFPVWKGSGWSRWALALGVRVYDLLCGGRNLGRSSSHSAHDLLARVPGLRAAGLRGGFRYFDALTNDARLVIDTLRTAAKSGAQLLNYTAYERGEPADGGWKCVVRDTLSGTNSEVRTRAVVNAAGAWAATLPHSGVKLRLTKGVHLVIDRVRLPVTDAVVLPEGNRILFVIPWGERVILGTTDTDYSGDPGAVRTNAADVEYVLRVVNGAFPSAALTPADVLATWAGVRPLIAPPRAKAGDPSDTSRNHTVRMTDPGWFDVAGGKLTTYRLMAEQTVDQVAKHLGQKLPPSRTAEEPLERPAHSGVIPPAVTHAVVRACVRDEWAVRLDDVLLRRTSWHYYTPGEELVQQTANWMGDEMGWDDEQRATEIARFRDLITSPGATEPRR